MNKERKYFVLLKIFIFVVLFSNCSENESESFLLNKPVPKGNYGKPFALNNPFTVSGLLNNPMDKIDKKIIVKGKIIDVCPMRGCWIQISDYDENNSIRIKVKDGEIIFPLSAIGSQIIVEGILRKRLFSQDQARNWKVHLAQEKGEVLNPENIKLAAKDMYEYRVECSGAIIL